MSQRHSLWDKVNTGCGPGDVLNLTPLVCGTIPFMYFLFEYELYVNYLHPFPLIALIY